MWAAAILAKMLPKGKLFGHRIAFFLRVDNELYQTINSGLIRLEYFDIFKDSKEHLERLKDYQPTIVVAPASTLIELANYVSNQQLAIQPVKVVSVAEILEERDAETIAKAFQLDTVDPGLPSDRGIFSLYLFRGQSTSQRRYFVCRKKSILMIAAFIRLLRISNEPVNPSIATRLNDILVEEKSPCPCGSVFTRIARSKDDRTIFSISKKKRR